MANVKTAISIQESLFNKIDFLSHKMHISRSQLFAKAAREFIQRERNRQILAQINKAYEDVPDLQEKRWQKRSKAIYSRGMEDKW